MNLKQFWLMLMDKFMITMDFPSFTKYLATKIFNNNKKDFFGQVKLSGKNLIRK